MSSDYVNFQEKLGMTDHQVLTEILMIRKFEKAVAEILSEKQMMEIYLRVARECVTEDLVENMGATPEEAKEVFDLLESEVRKVGGMNGWRFSMQRHDRI